MRKEIKYVTAATQSRSNDLGTGVVFYDNAIPCVLIESLRLVTAASTMTIIWSAAATSASFSSNGSEWHDRKMSLAIAVVLGGGYIMISPPMGSQ